MTSLLAWGAYFFFILFCSSHFSAFFFSFSFPSLSFNYSPTVLYWGSRFLFWRERSEKEWHSPAMSIEVTWVTRMKTRWLTKPRCLTRRALETNWSNNAWLGAGSQRPRHYKNALRDVWNGILAQEIQSSSKVQEASDVTYVSVVLPV